MVVSSFRHRHIGEVSILSGSRYRILSPVNGYLTLVIGKGVIDRKGDQRAKDRVITLIMVEKWGFIPLSPSVYSETKDSKDFVLKEAF